MHVAFFDLMLQCAAPSGIISDFFSVHMRDCGWLSGSSTQRQERRSQD